MTETNNHINSPKKSSLITNFSKKWWRVIKSTFREYAKDNAFMLGAALAYYTIFSLPGILVVSIYVATKMLGVPGVESEMFRQFRRLVGPDSAEMLQALMESATQEGAGFWTTIIGLATLVFGATGVFYALQSSINTIWKVKPKKRKRWWFKWLIDRLLSLAMVLSIGFILMVSLVFTSVLTVFRGQLYKLMPEVSYLFSRLFTGFLPFVLITLFFALIFKILPAITIRWRDVWVGAVFTAILFSLGKLLIGIYLTHSEFASVYGAAGSVIVILLWVFYSSQIVFLGAEFTLAFSKEFEKVEKTD